MFLSTRLGKYEDSRENKTNCFPRDHTLSVYYYMTSSVSGQDELNPALCLATRAGKMELSCPLGIQVSLGPARSEIIFWCFIPYNKSFIDQACSVKMAGYWPCLFFCVSMDHKHAMKESSLSTQVYKWVLETLTSGG